VLYDHYEGTIYDTKITDEANYNSPTLVLDWNCRPSQIGV